MPVMNPTERTVEVLNALLQRSRDGERAFQRALRRVQDPELARAFATSRADCAQASRELDGKIRELGGRPKTSAPLSEAVTRAWRGTRTLAPKRAKGLVREIVATQREAVEEYEDALGEPLPRGVRRLVASQAQEARAMLRRYVVRS